MNPIQCTKHRQTARFCAAMGSISSGTLARAIVFFLAAALLLASEAWARPTTEDEARNVAVNWLSLEAKPMGSPLGHEIRKIETFPDENGAPAYYVVHLLPSGLIFLPADDLVEPIIGFVADATSYDPSPANPLGALVSRDIPGRLAYVRDKEAALQSGETFAASSPMAKAQKKWALLSTSFGVGEGAEPKGASNGLSSVSDVRVAPFVPSRWNQACTKNGGPPCSASNPDAYNFYTPNSSSSVQPGNINNYVCGCAATAMAQVMRYFNYPTDSIGVLSLKYSVNANGAGGSPQLTGKTLGGDGEGGPYIWTPCNLDDPSKTPICMPYKVSPSTQLEWRQAIGRLTWDAGLAVDSNYTSSGTSGDFSKAADALMNTFGYSNAIYGYAGLATMPSVDLYAMVNPNLHAKYPVIFGIHYDPNHAHGVVCDGYGYNNSTIYHHVNMGWSGQDDAWYNLPNIRSYTVIEQCVYNIYTSGTGEIVAGRVTDPGGNPVAGANLTLTGLTTTLPWLETGVITDAHGIYAFTNVPSSAQYIISVDKDGYVFPSPKVSTGTSTSTSTSYEVKVGNVWMEDIKASQFTTGTTVTSSANPSTLGQPVTFTATVTSSGGTPEGTVQFTVGGKPLGGQVQLSAGSATSQAISSLTLGNHTVTANYEGEPSWIASSGSLPGGQTVNRGAPSISISSSENPSTYGDWVTFYAYVAGVPGVANPTGTVQFEVDGNNFGKPVTLKTFPISKNVSITLAASSAISSLLTGTHTVTADYSGDNVFLKSSGTLSGGQVVNQAASTTTVTTSPDPSNYGQSVTLTARVAGVPAGLTPTGTVQFYAGHDHLGGAVLSDGSAFIKTSSIQGGSNVITAVYSGDTNYLTSNSASTMNRVQVVNTASSTTSVTSSLNPSTYGQSVTFTAKVVGIPGVLPLGVYPPSGYVEFAAVWTYLGTPEKISLGSPVQIIDGSASVATSILPAESFTITATYFGDINYGESIGTLSQVVNKAPATVTLSNMTQIYTGSPLTPTATTSPSGLAVTWTGAPDTNAGTYPVTATVNDPNYTGSATGNFVINKAAATVTLSNMTQTYSGSPLTPTATTTPSGLPITWTGTPDTNAGTYPVTAAVNDPNYTGSANGSFVINKASSTTAVTSSENPSNPGDSIVFYANLSGPGGYPTGYVQFVVDESNFGDPVPVKLSHLLKYTFNTATSPSTSSLSSANHTVTANYLGDSNYTASSGTLTGGQNVKVTPTTSVSSSYNPSYYGDSITFTATVTGSFGWKPGVGGAYPTGTVQFIVDGDNFGSPVTLSGNLLSRQTGETTATSQAIASLPIGTHTVEAKYSGDNNFTTSSGTLSGGQTVLPPNPH